MHRKAIHMKAKPICKLREDIYISFLKKAGCEVKIDDEGIHASTPICNIHPMEYVLSILEERCVPHLASIDPNEIRITIKERYFKEVE